MPPLTQLKAGDAVLWKKYLAVIETKWQHVQKEQELSITNEFKVSESRMTVAQNSRSRWCSDLSQSDMNTEIILQTRGR